MNKNLFLVMIISIIIGSIIGGVIGSLVTYKLAEPSNNISQNSNNKQVQKVVYQQNVVIKEADQNTFVNVIEKVRESVARIDI
ncbi:MAG: hypothetical protein ACK4ZM_00770, partial [bacterium]